MKNQFRLSNYLALIIALLAVDAIACSSPPHALISHHSKLVSESENIVLAKVIGATEHKIDVSGQQFPAAVFETVEILKGSVAAEFSLPNGAYFTNIASDKRDFDQHRNAIFWDKHITRQWNYPDCKMYPAFVEGRTYLLFPDNPHWRSYEEIIDSNDLWLAAVRRLIKEPSLPSGLELRIGEWLPMTSGVYIGRIESCVGPSFIVEETLYGNHLNSWRYSNDEVVSSRRKKNCKIGQQNLIIKYGDGASPLPYYNSSVIPIVNNEVDFSRAIFNSELEIREPHKIELNALIEEIKPIESKLID